MVPSGPPTGTAQSVNPSLLRSNSGLLGGTQAGSIASQQPFSSLVSPHTQFSGNNNNSNMSLMGNMPSVSSLLNHSFANGGPGSLGGLSSPQVGTDTLGPGERDPMSFNSSSSPAQGQHFQNPSVTQDQTPQGHHLEGMQNFHHHYSGPQNHQHQQMGRGMGNGGSMATVKVEPQMGQVKLEPQQLQSMRSLGPVKIEPQYSNSSMFLQQQQHQQILQMSRQPSQAAAEQLNFLHKQRMLQIQQQQQQQQQQILKTMPQNRTQIQQQGHQVRPQGKPAMYEPGMCARRLTQYMDHQQHRPEDNNIEFWRKFVAEHFAPNAKKRWCVSLYGSSRQTTGVFPQDIWHCEICNRKPGRGFETTIEVLPRLFQIKYASGTLEELLYVDMPHEYHNTSGQIVLDYAKAVQESVFDQLRVVREGQLRIVFSRELKIYSWEFCARRHEELIPRRVLIPQVSQLGAVVQKYQTAANASPGLSAQDLQANCNSFVASARQLAKALEVPLVNDLGYTKRYVRCLQISEVVNSMKDLIDYSRETGTGPMDSLINFPRRTSGSTGLHGQLTQQPEQQQAIHQNQAHNGQNAIHTPSMQLTSGSTGITSVNNSLNTQPTTSMSATTIVGLLHQNSMNSRQENPMSSVNSSPYGGGNGNNTVQIPSATSSSHPNPSSPFTSPTPSTSNNNPTPSSHGSTHLNSTNSPANMSTMQQQVTQPHEPDPSESQSSVQQIFEEMMMSSQLNGNGIMPPLNNGIGSNPGVAMGFGSMGANGSRAVMTNNTIAMNGRVGMNHMPQDPMAMNHHHLNGLGSANSFSSLHFDWKPSP